MIEHFSFVHVKNPSSLNANIDEHVEHHSLSKTRIFIYTFYPVFLTLLYYLETEEFNPDLL